MSVKPLHTTAPTADATEAVVQYLVDYAVYIGRFEPLHLGHEAVIREALKLGKTVIVGVGSAFAAAGIKNPVSYALRRKTLIAAFRKEFREGRIIIRPVVDHTYENGAWQKAVLEMVNDVIGPQATSARVGLIGFKKDASSDYLDWFPDWTSLILKDQIGVLNASDIRHLFFATGAIDTANVSPGVARIMKRFKRTKTYRHMVIEQANVEHCRKTYGSGPFKTSDILIEHCGSILAIVRGGQFGHGLVALPGGINDGEDEIDCAFRELAEEVGIFRLNPGLTEAMLRSWIVNTEVFDKPGRDDRGEYHTTVVHIRIPGDFPRPVVKGDDDAKAARFIERKAFKRKKAFADHFHIVCRMLRLADEQAASLNLQLAA